MITWITLLVAAAIWGTGRTCLSLLDGTQAASLAAPARSRVESTSLACLIGFTLWAAMIMSIGLVMPIADLAPALGTGLLLLSALAGLFCQWRAPKPAPLQKIPLNITERIGLGLVILFAGFACFYAASMPVHIFDPVFHFAYKGKLLYHEGLMGPGWTDLESSIGRVITHPDYPPGVGAIESLVSWSTGQFALDATRPLMALFALSIAGLLYTHLSSLSRRAAITGSLLWLAMPFMYYSRLPHHNWFKGLVGLVLGNDNAEPLFTKPGAPAGSSGRWVQPDGWTLDGAGDLPLAALFSAGALLLFTALQAQPGRRQNSNFVIAGILLGGGALMKNEGLALLPIAAIAATAGWLFQSKTPARLAFPKFARQLATTFALAFVIASPWLAVRSSAPSVGEDYAARMNLSGIIEATTTTQPILVGERTEQQVIPRIIAGGFSSATTSIPRVGLLWILFFASLIFAALRPKQRLRGPVFATSLCVLGAFALYALVLLVTPWTLDDLFKTAIPDRLIFHVAPLAIFALVTVIESRAPSAETQDHAS